MANKKMWLDPCEGWRYGFPKLYDPDTDGDMHEWIYDNGYPRDKEIPYTSMWYDDEGEGEVSEG